MNHGAPPSDLDRILLSVEKPGRYVGGEFGMVRKDPAGLLRVVISYPDLYEIGMSNLAVRLIYQQLNALADVYCERVFAPAQDLEAELRNHRISLCSLETGTPLREFDIIGFSVGYELTLTNLLNILELGGIHPLARERSDAEPIVLAGGPAVTNPLPFGSFVDAVFIGEFESIGDGLMPRLAEIKAKGAPRTEMMAYLADLPYVWTAGRQSQVRRVHWKGFGTSENAGSTFPRGSSSFRGSSFPVPNIKTVQDHGVVEIMRGCPNGCRFCHAGIFYRPYRQKDPKLIAAESEEQVFRYGYREITLSSLSSGDYPGLPGMVRGLTRLFHPYKVSFSMPSLRVNSLTLDLLSELSAVRKSGLTFAVETPLEQWQRGLNKLATLERTLDLIGEAKKRGWRVAKFYFMVGLPVSQGANETQPIIDFLSEIRGRARMNLNVNVSCFIPKPHTPFQWAAQLTEHQALDRIMAVKRAFSGKGITVRYHSPFLSLLEGVVSRGGERVGDLFYRAFRAGARFDSWEELVQRDLWRTVLAEADWDVEAETCRPRDPDAPLPWSAIQLGVSTSFLRREYKKALAGELTAPCCPDCRDLCGVCGKNASVRELAAGESSRWQDLASLHPDRPRQGRAGRILFSFSKQGKAVYLSHLNVMQIFERALLRAGYLSEFTQGYNPKPRIEFAQPLSLGIASEGEIALAELQNFDDAQAFIPALNPVLPEGIEVIHTRYLPPYRTGQKKHSLMSLYRGSEYRIELRDPACGDPSLLKRLEAGLRQPETGEPPVPLVQAVGRASVQVGEQTVDRSANPLLLRIQQTGRGSGNIFKVLQSFGIGKEMRSDLIITRIRQFAEAIDGPEAAVSYFDLDF
jgi:radical SAM family uncharacterized protein